MSDADPSFSAAFAAIADQSQEQGASIAALAQALDRRSFGLLAFVLGLVLLIPVPIVLPQLAGLGLIVAGLNLLAGARAPASLRAMKKATLSKPRLAALAGVFAGAFGWLEKLWRARWSDLVEGFGAAAAGLALLLAGLAVLVGPSPLIGLGAILLGYGLMQRDGVFSLVGAAICLAASAFVLTMLGGVIVGAPFAAAWGETHAPWLVNLAHPPPKELIPADHAAR